MEGSIIGMWNSLFIEIRHRYKNSQRRYEKKHSPLFLRDQDECEVTMVTACYYFSVNPPLTYLCNTLEIKV
jgi:hypothetical protein